MCEGDEPSQTQPAALLSADPDGDADCSTGSLVAEIGELGRMLAKVKSDIASIQIDEFSFCHIPAANDELRAIIAQTEAATNEILDACETMEPIASRLDVAAAAQVQAATTRIFEACGFQDIIGQRINKVMSTLKTIDLKVERIIGTFGVLPKPDADPDGPGHESVSQGVSPGVSPGASHGVPAVLSDEHLMNGPQLPDLAMAQQDIDRMLSGS
jgi:chemotaxis protein CheZ